jgi:hypothetical protein
VKSEKSSIYNFYDLVLVAGNQICFVKSFLKIIICAFDFYDDSNDAEDIYGNFLLIE